MIFFVGKPTNHKYVLEGRVTMVTIINVIRVTKIGQKKIKLQPAQKYIFVKNKLFLLNDSDYKYGKKK